ncbi:MAG: hypothetical protein R3D78_12095 [Paracoccaceae bacterium]
MHLWNELVVRAKSVETRPILELFENLIVLPGLARVRPFLFDCSKTNLDTETRTLLVQLAEHAGLAATRGDVLGGEDQRDRGRAVLHLALRSRPTDVFVDGVNVMPEVRPCPDAGFCARSARGADRGAGQGDRRDDVSASAGLTLGRR